MNLAETHLRRLGFTLVELLVVITLIVILLSLLVPALDRAVYQAELVGCATVQRGLAQSSTNYAFNHRRAYPYRRPNSGDTPRHLQGPGLTGNSLDHRPVFRGFVNINQYFNDPFVEPVDYDGDPADGLTYSWASYHFFFGYKHTMGRGMLKLGDRWSIGSNDTTATTFSVLVADRDMIVGQAVNGGHPDASGVMASSSQQHELAGTNYYTNSLWASANGRGLIDMNVTFADISVERYAGVKSNLTAEQHEERMRKVPTNSYYDGYITDTSATKWVHLPPR